MTTDNDLLERITVRAEVFGGKPIIRDMRIAVEHVLGMLAAGDSAETILDEYPELEPEDIKACTLFGHRSPRVTFDPAVMGGKACIRNLRVTAGTVAGMLAAGRTPEEILQAYPYLERDDIDQCIAYAAYRSLSGEPVHGRVCHPVGDE